MSPATRVLAVVFPDWPAVAAAPAGPALAVVEGGRVVAATPAARRYGVAPGQRRREAEGHCPTLVVRARDPDEERRRFEPVVEALATFGAAVGLRTPGWAAIETRGPARYFGGEAELARRVAAAVAEVPVSGGRDGDGLVGALFGVGVAAGPFAATMAARRGCVVADRETAAFLAPLGLEVLGDAELVDVLRRLGITTLGGFAALPANDVLARFGREGGRAHRLASGLEAERVRARARGVERMAEATFDPPATRLEEVTLVARRLAETLCSGLFGAGVACSALEVTVETTDGEELRRVWSHDAPFSAALITERVRWQLESWITPEPDETGPERGVEQLRLYAAELTASSGRQGSLLGRSRVADDRVGQVLARVQGMLQPRAVLQAHLVGGRGPLERVRLDPFGDSLPDSDVAGLPWPGQLPAPSPTIVFFDPPSVGLVDATGEMVRVDGRGLVSAAPAYLVIGDTPVVVRAWAGPWPVDEQWWDAAARRRRARFQIVSEEGAAYLVALDHGRFILEGRYD